MIRATGFVDENARYGALEARESCFCSYMISNSSLAARLEDVMMRCQIGFRCNQQACRGSAGRKGTYLPLKTKTSESQRAHFIGTGVCRLTGNTIKIEWRACIEGGSVCSAAFIETKPTSVADSRATVFLGFVHNFFFNTRSRLWITIFFLANVLSGIGSNTPGDM
jgi:hypothetical protein